ncbi:FHA domain-containing protein [Nocardioides zeae]
MPSRAATSWSSSAEVGGARDERPRRARARAVRRRARGRSRAGLAARRGPPLPRCRPGGGGAAVAPHGGGRGRHRVRAAPRCRSTGGRPPGLRDRRGRRRTRRGGGGGRAAGGPRPVRRERERHDRPVRRGCGRRALERARRRRGDAVHGAGRRRPRDRSRGAGTGRGPAVRRRGRPRPAPPDRRLAPRPARAPAAPRRGRGQHRHRHVAASPAAPGRLRTSALGAGHRCGREVAPGGARARLLRRARQPAGCPAVLPLRPAARGSADGGRPAAARAARRQHRRGGRPDRGHRRRTRPRAERPGAGPAGRLVVLPEAHVSAVHLELRLREWSVLAVDRRSTNGTYLHRRGRSPERLTETPRELVPGDVLDLGHGAHVTFRPLPS